MLVGDARTFHKSIEAETAAGKGTKEKAPKNRAQEENLTTSQKPAIDEKFNDTEKENPDNACSESTPSPLK